MTRYQTLTFAYLGLENGGVQETKNGNYIIGLDIHNRKASYYFDEHATPQEIIDYTNMKRKQFGITVPAEHGDTGTKTIHQSSRED